MSILNKSISRLSVNLLQIAKYSVNVSDTSPFVFKSDFTTEEQEKVLGILNSSNLEQLASFSVSQSRIKNLKTWKNKKGPFRNLNEVLEVDGLGEKVLEKICEKIINDNINDQPIIKRNNVMNKRFKQLVSPPLAGHVMNSIQSTIGIHLGPMGISWAKLSRDKNELSDWSSEAFSGLPKKMFPADTFDLAIRIIRKLPPGDIYVLEANPSMSPQATAQISTLATYNQQLELTSMLIALLNTSVEHNRLLQCSELRSVENVVYHLRARVPARLFKTIVGTERVSALRTITELVENDGKSKHFSLPCTPISVQEQLRDWFLSQTPANKELLGQAVMLVVSFMDLCVYKNPMSLVAVGPGKNHNNK